MNDLLYMLWLHLLPGIGPFLTRKLLQHFSDAYTIYNASCQSLTQVTGIGKKLAQLIQENKDLALARKILEYCLDEKVQLISCQDAHYPKRLLDYPKSPTLLYVKGNISPLSTMSSVAIVGARRCSGYGKDATHQLATHISSHSFAVISGMAKGIDSYAHTSTIKNHGYTLAVVGTGIDRCYPSEHLSLMDKIVQTGAVISEFPPFTDVHKQNFIRRNELIAMLSDAIYVMQASKDSGALYTAQFGLSLGKSIFALPGSIYDPLSEGSHSLIAAGASIYLPEKLPIYPQQSHPAAEISLQHTQIRTLLAENPCTPDSLCHLLNIDLTQLSELLLSLELEGIVHQIGGLVHLSSPS